MMRLAVIREGRALLYIPDTRRAVTEHGGLEPAWLEVFYNPIMTFNRDLSVLIAEAFLSSTGLSAFFVDALAGTGVRGVRYALELSRVQEGIVNDVDPLAFRLINMNVKINALNGVLKPANRDANVLLLSLRRELGMTFNLVDVDPFGSPAPYLASAISALGRGGLLGVTATDLAVLGGSKPLAAKRRYWVNMPLPLRHYREVAIRSLLGYMARVAASMDRALKPLASFSVDHYVRLFVSFDKGARKSDEVLERNLGCLDLMEGGVVRLTDLHDNCYGPLWRGPLYDQELVDRALKLLDKMQTLESLERLRRVLGIVRQELSLQNYFHQRLDHLCSAQRRNMPSLESVKRLLTELGFSFSRTHLSDVGFRTNAPPEVLSRICGEALSVAGPGRS